MVGQWMGWVVEEEVEEGWEEVEAWVAERATWRGGVGKRVKEEGQ